MIDNINGSDEVPGRSDLSRLSRAELRRGRIIAAARTLFAENGFHNTGIAQIAKHSGVLVGQIYRDFANKEEIVARIVEIDLEPFFADAMLGDAVAPIDAQGMHAWIAHFIGGEADHDARLVAEIIAESTRNDRIAALFQSVQRRLQASIISALEILAPKQKERHRLAILADVILTMSAGVFQRRMAHPGPVDPELIAALTSAVCREIELLRQVD